VVRAYDAVIPRWSPDSKRLAFGWGKGDSYDAFAVISANGRGRIDVGADGDNVLGPVWSTDGRQIAFTRDRYPAPPALWLMNADGSNQHLLMPGASPDDADQGAPSWSPDGRELAFQALIGQSSGPGKTEVDVINIDGTQRRTIASNAYTPLWSPDGAEIAFTRSEDNTSDLLVMNADGSGQHRIAKGPIDQFAWKP